MENQVNFLNVLKIKKITDCKAEINNGSYIDLASLDNPLIPLSVLNNGREFLYNPCSPITCDQNNNKNSAVCQKLLNSNLKINCGEQKTASFKFKDNLIITYTSNERTSHITCQCDNEEKFQYDKDENLEYFFILKSKYCCATSVKGLSFGSILLLTFFCILTVYLIGGIIFLKFFKKKNGYEMVPNYDFWSSLPANVKDGVSFSLNKMLGRKFSYNQI